MEDWVQWGYIYPVAKYMGAHIKCPVCCQDNQMDAECLVVIAVSTVVTFQSRPHHRLIPICERKL